MPLIFYSSLIILTLLFGIQIGSRFFKINHEKLFRVIRIIFFSSVILIFVLLFYYSRQQFFGWHEAGPPAQYLVPPFSGIGYFLYYVLMRFWAPYLAAFGAALLLFFVAKELNKKYQERFFYPEEYYFLATSIFLVSHPAWIFYLIIFIFVYLLIQFINISVYPRTHQRISAYYLWIPMAILVIILSRWSVLKDFLQILKF